MVEDRDKYYKEKHAAAQQALLTALNSMGAAGTLAPEQVNNIAALLAMEGVSSEAVLNMLLQGGVSPPQVPPSQPMALPGMGYQNVGFGGAAQQAPQMPSDFFFQQAQAQQIQQQQQPQHSFGNLSMRSASGPLPSSIGPFGTMMSREGSLSSLSSISDWYSSNSSARTSLDLGNGGIFGQGAPTAPRRSLDAALQLRQQLMAAAVVAGAGGNVSNMHGVSVAAQSQWNAASRLGAAGPPQNPQIMQSAFYQASSIPLPQQQQPQQQLQQQQQGAIGLASASSMPLPVIREGMPSAVNGFPTELWASSGLYGPSATPSPVRRSPVGPSRVGMEYGAPGTSSGPPLMPLGLPDSSSSEKTDSTNLSSRTPSGTLETLAPGWQPPQGSSGDSRMRYSI